MDRMIEFLMELLKEERSQKQKRLEEKVLELEECCRVQERIIHNTYDRFTTLRYDQDSGDDDIIDSHIPPSEVKSYDFVG